MSFTIGFCYVYFSDYALYFHREVIQFYWELLLLNYIFIVVKGIIGKTLHRNLFDKQNIMIRFDAVVDAVVCTLLTQISRAVHNNTIIKNQGSRQYLVFGVGLKSESRDDESVT